MQLLVSVSSRADASAALAGGADVIDAKDPLAGALGAVTLETFRAIHQIVAGARPVSAALGDAADEMPIEDLAHAFTAAGASLVKVGFAEVRTRTRVAALIAAAVRGTRDADSAARSPSLSPELGTGTSSAGCGPGASPWSGVVAVAYADAASAHALPPGVLIDVAARAGARGVLIDTWDKRGPGLRELVTPPQLAGWVLAAQDAGLLVALAGKLTADDIVFVREAGADVAGVRGAACDGGREGRVISGKVRALRAQCQPTSTRAPALGP